MTFMEAIKVCFGKYVTWQGRAQRSEFWWFMLFSFAGNIVLSIVEAAVGLGGGGGFGLLSGLFGLVMFLPSLAVTVRRLHDIDKSGWWFWFWLVPLIGLIMLIVWYARVGTSGDNSYGSDPLGGGSDDNMRPSSVPSV